MTIGRAEAPLQPATPSELALPLPISFRQRAWVPLVLFLADVAALELALYLGWLTRRALTPWFPDQIGLSQLQALSVAVLIFPLFQALRGAYPAYGTDPVTRLRERTYATLFFFGGLVLWDYLLYGGRWARGVLLITAIYALALGCLADALVREVLVRLRLWGKPVVILGAAQTGALLARLLAEQPGIGWVPVAFLDDDPQKQGERIEGIPVMGTLADCDEWARRVRVAIVAMPGAGRDRLCQLVSDLRFPHVILVPDLLGLETLWIQGKDIGGVLGLEIRKNLFLRKNRVVKRILDYALGIPIALVSLPLIAFFALAIKVVSPGPAFFVQEREGEGGRPIRVWKLRTMYPDAEARLERYLQENPKARREWEEFFKLKDDPRILPGIGSFLRKSSLDELPQIWNVLAGQMSLVGPRPFPAYHLKAFPQEFRALRRRVRPGITGLWQVSARSDGDLEVQEALDTYYIRNWSIWLDLYILARTILVVLGGRGAY